MAILGILIFAVLVAFAARSEDFHIGFAALLAALLFGVFGCGLSVEEVLLRFPIKLFLTLAAVTLLFAIAETNGTLSIIAERSMLLCRGRSRLVPLIIFALTFILSALGVGNIAATALMAPIAMALARKLNLSAFLMSLIIVGGANAASLSPFSMTGMLLAELIKNAIPEVEPVVVHSAVVKIFFLTTASVTVVHVIGFLICGGFTWWRACGWSDNNSFAVDSVRVMNWSQRTTISGIFAFASGIVIGNLPYFERIIGFKLHEAGSQSLLVALVIIVLFMLARIVKTEQAISKVPWSTIILISGVITYLGVLEHAGAISLAADLFQSQPVIGDIVPNLALISAALSSISSSSGVVLPLFVPMVIELTSDSVNAFSLIATIAISAHLVDCSPFSTLGALCLASAKEGQTAGHKSLFRHLLIWGVVMIPSAVLLLWALTPYLNFLF